MRDASRLLTQKMAQPRHISLGVRRRHPLLGYPSSGQVGFENRLEYCRVGSVTNLASRLCDGKKQG